MKPVATVADYMTRDLVTLSPQTEINRAMNVLLDNRISGAPVVDERGALVGVLSKKDCLKAAIEASYYRDWGATVEKHMSKDVQTLDPTLDIMAAANVFLSSTFRRFPVVEAGQLVGQISRADALRAMRDNWV